MNRRKSITYTAIFVLILAVLLTSLFSLKECFSKTISRTFFLADTVCSISIYNGDQDVLDGAVDIANNLSKIFNCKDEQSEVSELNLNKRLDSPSADLLNVIETSLYFCNESNGVFDISIKPLSDLWNFKNEKIPEDKKITDALKKVDYKNIIIKNNSIFLKNNAEIDLGGIAKGYIANKISDFLSENGVKSAVINLGGNITVIGKKDGNKFNIGVQKPFEEGNICNISCSDTSVVTSGIYQRYFKNKDKIYHHLLNSETGYPEQNSLYSVTIITNSSTRADALSTLCFLLGKDKGMEYVETLDNVEAIFIDTDNKLHITNGLKITNNTVEIK